MCSRCCYPAVAAEYAAAQCVPVLGAEAKSFMVVAGSRGFKAPSSSALQPKLLASKAGRPKEDTSKPARQGKAKQVRRLPSSRLRSMTQMTLTWSVRPYT